MRDLTKGSIYKSFILFAVPLILSGLLVQGYSIIDNIIAGKFLGEHGLATIGATSQAITLACSVFWGFGAGVGVYIAKRFGANEYKEIKTDVYNIMIISVAVVALFGVILVIFGDGIIALLRVEDNIRRDAKIYYSIYTLGLFLIIANNTFMHIMNALGSSSFPFLMSVLSAVLNISGNILSVTVFKMGIAGIALSSVFSATMVDIAYILNLKACYIKLGIKKEKIKLSFSAFRHILRYAIPTSLQQTAMYIAAFLMSPIVNGIGAAATAGYTVVLRIYNVNACIYQQSAKTVSNYAAQCVGAKEYKKIRKGLFVGLVQGMVFVMPMILLCSLFAPQVNSLFFPSGYKGEALNYAILFSRVYLPFIAFNVINNLFHSFFRGIAAMRLLIVATVLGSVARILSGLILAEIFGMDGIYIGWAISWIAEAVFLFFVYLFKFRNTEMIQRHAERNFV